MQSAASDQITRPQVEAYIEAVTASGVMGRSRRRLELLKHLLLSEISGQGERLKGYSIGLDVFDRGDDFDPAQDSIVRVEIGRLRDAIALFDATPHAQSVIRVTIPKGSYRPEMAPPVQVIPNDDGPTDGTPLAKPRRPRPLIAALAVCAVAIAALAALYSARPTSPSAARGIAVAIVADESVLEPDRVQALGDFVTGLANSLSHNDNLSVAAPGLGEDATYEVRATIVGRFEDRDLIVQLVDRGTGRIFWANSFTIEGEDGHVPLADMVRLVSREVTPRLISSSKRALDERPLADLSPWELYLLSTWVPGQASSTLAWERERRDLAQRAVDLDPDLANAHSVLADKLAFLSSVSAADHSPETVARARSHAATAMQLRPSNISVLFNVAIHNWHLGEIDRAVRYMDRILELDPDNGLAGILTDLFRYTCAAATDETLQMARSYDQGLGPDNPIRWVTLTWLGMLHLNRGELDHALEAEQAAATIFRTPDTVMRHAVIENALGNTDRAAELLRDIAGSWPEIDPAHFAAVTMPRRCKQYDGADALLAAYDDLAAANVRPQASPDPTAQ